MPKLKRLTDPEGDVRELTLTDLRKAGRASGVMPKSLQEKLGVQGPQRAPLKERITIRLSPEVVRRFKSTGAGWQTRMDAALQDWLQLHEPA